jgi:hypothetical protein
MEQSGLEGGFEAPLMSISDGSFATVHVSGPSNEALLFQPH